MTITTRTALNAGLFVPLMQRIRGGDGGSSPVGTISQEITGLGDSSGGNCYLALEDQVDTLGFRAIYVPTFVAVVDGLSAVGAVEFQWDSNGNRRLANTLRQVLTTVRVGSVDIAQIEPSGIIIEPSSRVSGGGSTIALASWPTNSNGVTYRLQFFFAVYDAEDIERRGSVSDLLAGVR